MTPIRLLLFSTNIYIINPKRPIMSNQNYRLEEKNSKKIDVHLLYITEAKYEQDWHSLAQYASFYRIDFYYPRNRKIYNWERVFPVKENDLIIVNPNVSHTESGGTGTPLEYIVLGINGLQFTDKDEFTNYTIHNFFTTARSSIFTWKCCSKRCGKRRKFWIHLPESSGADHLEYHSSEHRQHCPLLRLRRSQGMSFIDKYLDEHFKEDITLQTLSDLTYLNKYYLVQCI